MNRFAALLDRLAYEPGRNNKLRLIADYLRTMPDPERGYALAALTGALSFQHAKPGMIRALIAERSDPVLFELSYDYVGDLSETVALMWPAAQPAEKVPAPTLTEVVEALSTMGKTQLPAQLSRWLDALDETGRWALLKLVTGALRIGVSARLAKTAAAALGDKDVNDIEMLWPGLSPPYRELFAWLEGRAESPQTRDPVPFRPAMLAHALDDGALPSLDPADFAAEWKWDGIRVQAVAGATPDGRTIARLYSRTGEDISGGFPDLVEALRFNGAIDGELLIVRDGRVQSFNVLQQRLNRKAVTAKLLAEFPAHLRAYDLLVEGDNDLRTLPFGERRGRLEALVRYLDDPRIDVVAADRVRHLGCIDRGPRRPGRCGRRCRRRGGRGRDAQAPRFNLRAGPSEGAVVEVEARPDDRRRGADVRPARPRQALVLLFRLHVRRLDQG